MNFVTGSDKLILKLIFQIGFLMMVQLLLFLFKTLVGYRFELCRMKEKGINEWLEDVFYDETKFSVLVEKYNTAVVEYKKGAIKRKKKELNQDFK